MTLSIFNLPGNEPMADALAALTGAGRGQAVIRRFPDGETYVRVLSACAGHTVVIVATLDRPDEKTLPLIYLARQAKEQGAIKVGLVAPYLGYMRQDRRFLPGEAVTSRFFAQLLSTSVDWLVTVDPHLHRYQSLGDVYTIPTFAAHAAPLIGAWVCAHVPQPLVIGPDSESLQWVAEVARHASAPYTILSKERMGDRDVRVVAPDLSRWAGRVPVLVDDIISTARTVVEASRRLAEQGFNKAMCVGVHGIFAEGAFEGLHKAGIADIVTCNTVPHFSNRIDVSPLLLQGIREMTTERRGVNG